MHISASVATTTWLFDIICFAFLVLIIDWKLPFHCETYPKPNLTKPHAGIYLSPNPNLSLTCQAQVFSDVH